MTEQPHETTPAPGTSHNNALRSALGFRIGMAVIAFVFGLLTLHNLIAGPTTTLVINAVAFTVTLTVFACAHTTRIWIQNSLEPGSTMYHQWTLNKTQFGRHTVGYLRSPHTLRIHAAAPTGPRPSWRVTVSDPDGNRTFTCSAPWVGSLPLLLSLLGPIAAGDRNLPADEETRNLLLPRSTEPGPTLLDMSSFDIAREYPGQPAHLNVAQLLDLLQRSNAPDDAYAINPETIPNEAFVLTNDGNVWTVYYSEHGLRTAETRFASEEAACAHLLGQLRRMFPGTTVPHEA